MSVVKKMSIFACVRIYIYLFSYTSIHIFYIFITSVYYTDIWFSTLLCCFKLFKTKTA